MATPPLPGFLDLEERRASYRTRADIERFIGVDPVEQLHSRRRALWQQHAALYARVQVWDAKRKKLVSLINVEIANRYRASGAKVPAADLIAAEAHADERYVRFLDRAEADIAAWAIVEDDIKSIDELINRDQRIIGFATAEAKV